MAIDQRIVGVMMAVVVLIIFYIITTWNTGVNEDYLYGSWLADDDEFCDESDIASMQLFIGESSGGWLSKERSCYIVIMNDICNQGLTLTYRPGWSGPSVGKYRIDARVEFDSDDIWPEDVTIDVNMTNGTMCIHNDETVYARLLKQHDVTNSCRALDKLDASEAI